jgi:regulator of cell morphogenesis and NO signaling
LCEEYNVDLPSFLIISNLYNGFFPEVEDVYTIQDLETTLNYLKNSHCYYREEKYPELKHHLQKLKQNHDRKDIEMIEDFFNDYFIEVLDHLKYEDEIAFPYFYTLSSHHKVSSHNIFSVQEYRNDHTDIETKLVDLKNLFLKYIKIKDEGNIKYKFLNCLFGLETDLKIHCMVEEKVLMPIAEKLEAERNG